VSTVGTTNSCAAQPAAVSTSGRSVLAGRIEDYFEMAKPRIVSMALVAVAVGYTLGSRGQWPAAPLAAAVFGIALVAAAGSILNQWWERKTDARMLRTAARPLAGKRIPPAEALLVGFTAGGTGFVWLALTVNLTTALLTLATLVLYAAVYTPLKRYTSFCTAVGAVPGALPPVLGWTAAGGTLGIESFSLFAILFLWQFPHFLAIAWIYRNDYAAADLKMLPAGRNTGRLTAALCVVYSLILLPISLIPSQLGLAGDRYFIAALLLSSGYLTAAVLFLKRPGDTSARGLLRTSLVYLPLLLIVLCWDHVQLLR